MTEQTHDPLTGTWSRFGLVFFAEHYVKLLRRLKREAILFVVGVDGLPADGPAEADDEARLREVARLLLRTFRTSDAVARIGPNAFAVLLLETSELAADALRFRLEDRLAGGHESLDGSPLSQSPSMPLLHLVMDRIHPDQELTFHDALARTEAALRARLSAKTSHGCSATGQ